jgi:P27 family predicted phage terminase small subunit
MKTGRPSSEDKAARVALVRPFERLQPPSDLTEDGRKIFLDIVLANEPTHFRASDLPLLCTYVRAILQERAASERLAAEGYVIDGERSPWLAVQGQAHKTMVALSHRLRLSPQSRSPTNPKRVQPTSYFDRLRLEHDSDDDIPMRSDKWKWPE